MTDFNQKTHDTDVGSYGGQSRQMTEVFENQEFGSIRLFQEAGKTFFCASDVAKALGYVNPYAAVRRHCRGPLTKREGVVQKVNQYGDAGEQVVEIAFITEGDVYRLIVHSKLPSAERFEHWVFDEVLPSIRKHGGQQDGVGRGQAGKLGVVAAAGPGTVAAAHQKEVPQAPQWGNAVHPLLSERLFAYWYSYSISYPQGEA